jgi:multidrug efflux system membrane fusion protein
MNSAPTTPSTSAPPPAKPAQAPGKRHKSFVILALILIAIVLVVWRLWPRQAPPRRTPVVPVTAGHAITADMPIRAIAVGAVRALNTVDVKVRVDGQMQKIMFNEGQDVRVGQVLAQLDQGPLQAALNQAEAAQRKDQASLDNAKLDLQRYTKLAAIGATTSQTLDTSKAQVESLEATVAADAALVQTNKLQLSFTTLYAPFNGRVGMREADVGAIVHPGDATGVVTVTQMEPINVLFSVPQDLLPDLLGHHDTPQQVTVTTRTNTTPLATGTLTFIDSQVDPTTGQIKLKASFDNKNRILWPGELVNAQILLRVDQQRMAVPDKAIVNTQDGTQLYVIDANNVAQLRPVKTGASVNGLTEIRSGITMDDLIVIDGQSRVAVGAKVKTTIAPVKAVVPTAPANPASVAPASPAPAPANTPAGATPSTTTGRPS